VRLQVSQPTQHANDPMADLLDNRGDVGSGGRLTDSDLPVQATLRATAADNRWGRSRRRQRGIANGVRSRGGAKKAFGFPIRPPDTSATSSNRKPSTGLCWTACNVLCRAWHSL